MINNRADAIQKKAVNISCIVPVYNEAAVIEQFLPSLAACLQQIAHQFEILVIDDGSHDDTAAKVLSATHVPHLKLISLSRNFGKEIALTAGIEHASGDAVIMIDADFQHPLEMIPLFLQKWSEGYDMVYGKRRGRENESFLKRKFAGAFYWLMQKITKINIPNDAGDFRLLDKKIVQALKLFPERTRFMKGLYAWVGYKSIGIPFTVQDRIAGKSSWRFSKLTELAITGIISFSDVPLRVWSFVGFVISLSALVCAVYFLVTTLLFGADLPGFPTLVVGMLFLGGVQLLSIGILGEYIARIFAEVKQRPKYLVQLKRGFDDKVE